MSDSYQPMECRKGKTVLETLEAARKLIEKPAKWTQGAYFRDKDGYRVWGSDPNTPRVRCCMVGALSLAEGSRPVETEFGDAFRALKEVCDPMGVVGFNDTHTHAEVLAAFDAAIAKARTEGK